MLALLMAMLPLGTTANQSLNEHLVFSNAWVKKPMPGMAMSAGYVDIENTSSADVRLIAVRISFSKMSELHNMVMVNKVM